MNEFLINENTLSEIANAIREKLGTTELISAGEFPEAIRSIPDIKNFPIIDGYNMESGIFIPSEDISSPIHIPLQNTYVWNKSNRTTNTYIFLCAINAPANVKAAVSSMQCRLANNLTYVNVHNMCTTGTGVTTSSTDFITLGTGKEESSNLLQLTGTATYPMKAGIRYLWVVIGETVI